MNYNPLEKENNLYSIHDLFTEKQSEYRQDRISANDEILKKYNIEFSGYDYLLYTLTDKIEWFLEAGYKDYQGNFFYLGKSEEGKYYFLNQGYGSCSGCDAYQASEDSIDKLNELREDMKRSIIEFDSLEEFRNYIDGEDSRGNYYWYDRDFKDFMDKINEKFGWDITVEN